MAEQIENTHSLDKTRFVVSFLLIFSLNWKLSLTIQYVLG